MSRKPARVVEVRRTENTVTLFWDKQPTPRERHEAQQQHAVSSARIGHSWAGEDDRMGPSAWAAT